MQIRFETWRWKEGVLSQEKADGMYVNVDHEEGSRVRLTTRQGNERHANKDATVITVKSVRSRTPIPQMTPPLIFQREPDTPFGKSTTNTQF
ncbi:hypothetical protein PPGU19_091060 (plasmid) [Paraburkholderia sp. PGU19]|uniref:hypothetical protein n=1 Tax=Paraburkholderia sp. PGU19 TaxID=2735434 RepID=UPI0015DB67AB|nr:hypothetical protein [Paraburkholderia sp. PGU19]BCG04538.1 hypothetical protein PPGU19_091060 [Paraburkholderia sp. PGU19]